ncbi:saccharopine dehydrogenase family protein [Nonomuraea cavernae]|uniref:Saccharopine dehydrogenase NADP binding domain-containing protein n=1 Tax=Nonomuraea cavernae TaxID=2045107 RepID=A0A917YUF6_9ACTN|nr:saccharopine dehydrogenase NADP-binding domain-containing protein [Nonomuraea cavernae]MCA2184889.1 saccharopine dehydrogenase NADP-binding domain-containing protein [Nonomuraea cavernae]GGO64767.1 hypothetical protein GCM10012289_14880 [Nonomuraea cavernae]
MLPENGTNIVILGGYGAVGRAAASTLGQWFPGRVVVAGRDPTRGAGLARTGAVQVVRADVNDPADVDRLLLDAAVVVMCVERANARVARACLERGVHYVDVSASLPVLESIAALDGLAARHGATAVLSVGVAPGLTNLLARHCVDRLPSARAVDLSLMLGLGGEHGADSVDWVVRHLAEPAARGRHRARTARVRLGDAGTRIVHPFPFSDQFTIAESLKVRATTRICFDSRLVTSAVFALRRARVFSLVRHLGAGPLAASALSRLHFGSDRFVVHAVASDEAGDAVWSTITGRETCNATGVITAYIVKAVFDDTAPHGVVHIDRFLDPGPLLGELTRHHMTVRHSAPGT